jgi:serine/threonine-protein kinase RsbW
MTVAKTHSEPDVIRLTVPSRLDLLSVVDKVIDGITDQMNFEEDDKDAVAISVLEAGTNAIQHGHAHDVGRVVEMVFSLHPEELVVDVYDGGRGFQPEVIDDASAPENLLKERGRGIFIMRSMMDEVTFDFTDRGTRCRLVKKRRPATPEVTGVGEPIDEP